MKVAMQVVAAFLALLAPAFAEERRVDLFTPEGTRQGHAIVDRQTWRVDYFDAQSRRTGWGQLAPSGKVERFGLRGQRQGYAIVHTKTGRVDFFDVRSRRIGWGRITPSGKVESFDLDGKRQEETALPIPLKSPQR